MRPAVSSFTADAAFIPIAATSRCVTVKDANGPPSAKRAEWLRPYDGPLSGSTTNSPYLPWRGALPSAPWRTAVCGQPAARQLTGDFGLSA